MAREGKPRQAQLFPGFGAQPLLAQCLNVSGNGAPDIWIRRRSPRPTKVFTTYFQFAAERQEIFFRRLEGLPAPWTEDPILGDFKFTNAYRASDRVSQFLIRQIIYSGDQSANELLFRILLFKLFNRIETWRLLTDAFGDVRFESYRFKDYDRVLSAALEKGRRIYSAAYIMPSGGRGSPELRKHRMHLRLLESMMENDLPSRLADSSTMAEAFSLLRSYPTIGDFLAYQYVTDINYSTLLHFDESEFVVPGPGALDGIGKCFPDLEEWTPADVIRHVADEQQTSFEALGLQFRSLWGRPLQLIDCQNLFCEVDKYARVRHPDVPGRSGRTRIKQRFCPNLEAVTVWYPPKWLINHRITNSPACS